MNLMQRFGGVGRLAMLLVTTTCAPIPSSQANDLVFECAYENYAWGRVLSGFYIQANGDVYSFESRGDRAGIPPRDAATAPKEKYPNPKLTAHVDAATLQEKTRLLVRAAQGTLNRQHTAADRGQTSCVGFLKEEKGARVVEVKLGGEGDFRERSSAPEAQALHEWLQGWMKR